jgi:DNA polymerase-3 subunit alpha
VNRSFARFSVEDGKVRYALAAIRNVGAQAMDLLVAERERGGPYKDVADLARRLDTTVINRRQLENLVKAGALDSLEPNRRKLFDGIDAILKLAGAAAAERDSKQDSLFGNLAEAAGSRLILPDVADWSANDRLRGEYEAIGFYLSAHPLDGQARLLQRLGVVSFAEIMARSAQGVASLPPKLAGVAISYRVRTSAKGSKYAVVQMSDPTGMFEIWAFNEVFAAHRDLIDRAAAEAVPLVIDVDVQRGNDEVRFFARGLKTLDQVAAQAPQLVQVFLSDAGAAQPLRNLLAKERGGRGTLRLIVPDGEDEIDIKIPGTFALTTAVQQAIKSLPGVLHVEQG